MGTCWFGWVKHRTVSCSSGNPSSGTDQWSFDSWSFGMGLVRSSPLGSVLFRDGAVTSGPEEFGPDLFCAGAGKRWLYR